MARSNQFARLQARMDAIPQAVRDAVKPVVVASAEELAARMRSIAPEDEGDLKDSIEVTGPGETTPPYSQPGGSKFVGDLSAVVTVGNDAVRYAHLLEYGTANAPSQAFFWPSVRLNKKKIERRIKRAISKAVKEAWQQ